ncbi:NAD(P)/FAD-dependent oxidoreductase [Mycobacterium sp. EPa45]|uniref:NAD(P)/FAD-dependent oxidoreductase n=1 Tax=Mycobacterium sp. EPa45 TaxID=1545728 RepID=UPI000642639D|nr:NAD(P)/FAD-dependent oxidoreductase [Mycobacterium sp. EPa45]AKK28428.1 pyridine nucleotide-disulfide oxidoreductase [Mycobacterium sp. EPa45]
MTAEYDCIVVGGGAAGLSAALVLGRARRRTLLVDAGDQSNLPAHGVGGLLGFDGRPPAELYALGREQLTQYPSVEVITGEVVDGADLGNGFRLVLADDSERTTRRVLLATGVEYRPPGVPGLRELWGSTVFHCPFCHGWEVRDQPLAVLANGEKALHATLLIRNWTDDVVLLTDGRVDIDADGLALLDRAGVPIDARRVEEVAAENGRLSAVVFTDGSRLERSGLMVATTLHQRTKLADQLGAMSHEHGPVVTDPIDIDGLGRTTVAGLFAAGDVCTQAPQVATAIATGSVAATAVVQSLLTDDTGLPFPPRNI